MISEKRKETYKMKNCGISRWDDPAEINRKLKYLTSQPIWEVDDDYYDNVVMKYFDEKCKGSREIYEESGIQQAVSHVHGQDGRSVFIRSGR